MFNSGAALPRGLKLTLAGVLLGAGAVHAQVDDGPRVVVSVIDSGINPYHDFFYADGPLYADLGAPAAITPAVLAEFGVLSDCQLSLTRTGDYAADFAGDAAQWAAADQCDMVWFQGTNILARSFDPGSVPYQPDNEDDTHGVGVTAAVLTANPEAVIVFLEGAANAEAEQFAMTHPAIDLVTTSYGPIGSIPIPENLGSSFAGTYDWGKLHFGACDNSPSPAVQDATCGPWWSVGIAGFEETQANEPAEGSNGRQLMSGTFPDFIADYYHTLPYCASCEDGYQNYVGGTSFATPRAAGTASRVLLEARRALGYVGGPYVGQGRPLMAAGILDGQPLVFTNWQLRRALERAAWVPSATDYDPIEGVFDQSVPVNPLAPWLQIGWGVLSPTTETGVVAGALAALGVTGDAAPEKDAGYCEFQNSLIAARKLYWDEIAVLSETFLNAPSPDPYEYCDSTVGALADTSDAPQDSDGDGTVDTDDNCPITENADQADSDGDGTGDACDTTPGDEEPAGDVIEARLQVNATDGDIDHVFAFDASTTSYANGASTDDLLYQFVFGDEASEADVAEPAASPVATHRYANAGSYQAYVTVSHADGRSDSSEAITITVTTEAGGGNGTVAQLKVDRSSGPAPLTVTFDGRDSFAAAGEEIVEYCFDFDDGQPPACGEADQAMYTYTAPGEYAPALTVRASDASESTAKARVAIAQQGGSQAPGETGGSGGLALFWLLSMAVGAGLRRRFVGI